ncbi:MAG: cytochrome C oxidase subunit IV family protein [Reichenbachiella sp.]
MEQEIKGVDVVPPNKEKIKRIWTVMLILAGWTSVEFIIAFTMSSGMLKTSIFIVLTIVKAFYIVGEFMHLKHESKALIWTILLPCLFVVWLILALLIQGDAIYTAIFG